MSEPTPAGREGGPKVRADAIVVAAGASQRMGTGDKLALPVGDRPLLAWTLAAVAAAPEVERIVLVTSAERLEELEAADWLPTSVVRVVVGGARRQESVAAGFSALEALDAGSGSIQGQGEVVLVHDGARPCVTPDLVSAVARAAALHGAAIPVLPVADTLKRLAGDRVLETVERASLAAAQTPQGVRRDLLRRALASAAASSPTTWTDEAALLEACKIDVHAIPGEASNVKVTVPADLERVELALLGARPSLRVGYGHDSHPFGPGTPLALGGIEIPGAPRLHGHSDGDVVLHAVADALLGAAGLGDLGRLFPADARTPRGVASRELLATVVERLREHGLRPVGVDVTLIAARPRLAPRLDEMRAAIAATLALPAAAVGVKASSGNLDGAEGEGRAISARAVATVALAR